MIFDYSLDFDKLDFRKHPELAPVYVFMASQASTYITSECIGVTGGKVLA